MHLQDLMIHNVTLALECLMEPLSLSLDNIWYTISGYRPILMLGTIIYVYLYNKHGKFQKRRHE